MLTDTSSIPTETIIIAFSLTLFAGLATGIGSLIAFFAKRTNTRFLATSMGLSAGVMIYISFMEMMPDASRMLGVIHGTKIGYLYMLIAFFVGMMFIALIDFFVPDDKNPHEMHSVEEIGNGKMKKTGIMLALIIGIHNFPEGLASFAAALENLDIAIPIVIAIAIHNIPEGIAISVPIYHATGDKKKAFKYSFLSGLAEPIGALVGFLILLPFWSPTINALLLSFVSGIMVFISFDELLPAAERFGHHHYALAGVIGGMMVMAVSLILL